MCVERKLVSGYVKLYTSMDGADGRRGRLGIVYKWDNQRSVVEVELRTIIYVFSWVVALDVLAKCFHGKKVLIGSRESST